MQILGQNKRVILSLEISLSCFDIIFRNSGCYLVINILLFNKWEKPIIIRQ